jgi:hypothetical protein
LADSRDYNNNGSESGVLLEKEQEPSNQSAESGKERSIITPNDSPNG